MGDARIMNEIIMLAEAAETLSWPEAVMNVGIAIAIAATAWAFFWGISR